MDDFNVFKKENSLKEDNKIDYRRKIAVQNSDVSEDIMNDKTKEAVVYNVVLDRFNKKEVKIDLDIDENLKMAVQKLKEPKKADKTEIITEKQKNKSNSDHSNL